MKPHLYLAAALCTFAGAAQAQDAPSRAYPTDLTNIALAANGGRIVAVSSVIDNDTNFKADNLIDGKIYDAKQKGSPAG